MPEYLQLCESSYGRDQTGIRRIELIFNIPGPVQAAEDGGDDPFEILDSWSPTKKPLGLEEIDRKAAKQSDGSFNLHIGYAGAPNDNAFGIVVEIDYASVDSPLESLENFDEFAKKWSGRVMDDKLEKFDRHIKDPTTGKMIKNPVWGQTHFLETNPVLRITFGARKFYPGLFVNCSKIQQPGGLPSRYDDVVKSPDNRTWLKRTVKARSYGNAWQFSIEYMLGLWNPDIYLSKKDDNLKAAIDASTAAARSGGGGTD